MDNGERLKVQQAARAYVVMIVELVNNLPRSAPAGLRGQLAEAAQSVSAILAEGFGRGTPAEEIHYSRMANGSLEESQNFLRECINTGLIDRKTFYRSWNLSIAIGRMLAALIARLQRDNE